MRWLGLAVSIAAALLTGCNTQGPTFTPAPSPAAITLTFAPTWTPVPISTASHTPTGTAPPTETPFPPTPNIASRILFVSEREGQSAIYYIDVDKLDESPVKLTSGETAETAPVFSPDRQYIAYVSFVWGDPDIFVRKTSDPTQVMQLTRHTAADEWPAWAPDGQSVLFASDRDGTDRFSLYRVPLGCGRWGADSLNGAMACESQMQRITDAGEAADIYPAWAPAETILFASNRQGGEFDLYSVVPGADPLHLTGSIHTDWFPAWAPDGRQFAFTSGGPEMGFHLYVALRDGTHVRQITRKPGVQNSFPVWSPDGSTLVYVSTVDGVRDMYTVDLASGEKHRLTEDGHVVMVGSWAQIER